MKPDGYFYYSYNSGLQPQSVTYRIHKTKLPAVYDERETSKLEELFFDSNRLSKDGTAALAASSFSKTGKYYAYGVSNAGSDWYTAYVRETSKPHPPASELEEHKEEPIGESNSTELTTQDVGGMSDVVRFVKFSGLTWLHDDSGFLYQRYPTKELDHHLGTGTDTAQQPMLFFHKLGTNQEEDVLFMQDEEHPDWMFSPLITDDGRYLLLSFSKDTSPKELMWMLDLKDVDFTSKDFDRTKLEWKKIVTEWKASLGYIANDDTKFWFTTNNDAPKSKIVTYDVSKPEEVSHTRGITAQYNCPMDTQLMKAFAITASPAYRVLQTSLQKISMQFSDRRKSLIKINWSSFALGMSRMRCQYMTCTLARKSAV